MSTSFERGINAFKQVIDAPVAAFFSSCVHCGLCAETCLFYTETGDAQYTPIHKLEPLCRTWQQEYTLLGRLLKAVGLSKPVTDDELAAWSPLVYDSCSMCGRCWPRGAGNAMARRSKRRRCAWIRRKRSPTEANRAPSWCPAIRSKVRWCGPSATRTNRRCHPTGS